MIEYWKKKFSGYQRYWRHEQSMRKYRRAEEQSQRLYHRWLSDIKQRKPDVFLTANQQFGGVRNHLLAIERYSGLNIEVVPNERSFPDFKLLTESVRDHMIQQIPDCLAMHSHVMPWAIHWGKNAKQKGVRWVHTYHLNYFPEHGTAGLKPWQIEVNDALLNIAPHADIRLSVARWQQKDLAAQHGIQSYYLPNGVDVQSCDLANADRFIKKSGQRDFVIYVGRHDPVKNPGEFVQLARAMPKQQFVMVGQNIDAETLRREYGQEPPANLYIHGPEDHAGVQDAIAASSAVVVTSFREGLPTLVLEAMTQGKPIVVPNEAGCREAIAEGDFGFIYEHGNVDDLAQKTTAALAQKQCPEARQRVLKAYDWRVVAKELDHVYREPDETIVEEQLTRWQQI